MPRKQGPLKPRKDGKTTRATISAPKEVLAWAREQAKKERRDLSNWIALQLEGLKRVDDEKNGRLDTDAKPPISMNRVQKS